MVDFSVANKNQIIINSALSMSLIRSKVLLHTYLHDSASFFFIQSLAVSGERAGNVRLVHSEFENVLFDPNSKIHICFLTVYITRVIR